MEQNWFEDDAKPMDEMTLKEFDSLLGASYAQKKKVEEMEEAVSVEKAKLEKAKKKILGYLSAFNQTSFKSQYGMVVKRQTLSVKCEDKEAFAKYLEGKGVLYEKVTFHHRTLADIYKQEMALAVEEGREINLPGIGKPEMIDTLAFNK